MDARLTRAVGEEKALDAGEDDTVVRRVRLERPGRHVVRCRDQRGEPRRGRRQEARGGEGRVEVESPTRDDEKDQARRGERQVEGEEVLGVPLRRVEVAFLELQHREARAGLGAHVARRHRALEELPRGGVIPGGLRDAAADEPGVRRVAVLQEELGGRRAGRGAQQLAGGNMRQIEFLL